MTYMGSEDTFNALLNGYQQNPSWWATLMDVDGDGLPDIVGADISCSSSGSCNPTNSWLTFNEKFERRSETCTEFPMSVYPSLGATPAAFLGPLSTWAIGNWTADSSTPGASVLWWDLGAANYQVFTPHWLCDSLGNLGGWDALDVHKGVLPPHTGLAWLSPASPLATFADIDGDGLLDWIRQDPTTNRITTFYTTQDAFGAIHPLASAVSSLPVQPLPSSSGLQPQTFFVDANGDGVPDIVYIPPSDGSTVNVKLMVLRGHGDGTFDDPPGYILADLPTELSEEVRAGTVQLFLHDVNGDGIADLIAYDSSSLDVYLSTGRSLVKIFHSTLIKTVNLGGGSFELENFGPLTCEFPQSSTDCLAPVAFADMEGSGTDDIVFTEPYTWGLTGPVPGATVLRWLHVLRDATGGPGIPQGLLSTISNGWGATTSIEYVSSASLQSNNRNCAQSSAVCRPNPQVLHVVSEIATTLKDPTKVLGGPYEMRYEYDSPVYDFRHRQFVGFEHVRAIRTNTPEANSVATDTFFALANNCFESGCQQLDEPILAVRDRPVFSLVRDLAGHYLSATHHKYAIKPLYIGLDGRQTRYAYDQQNDTWAFDSSARASATTNISLQDIDDQETSPKGSSQTRNQSYAFPKFSASDQHLAETVHMQSTQIVDYAGNVTNETDLGIVTGAPSDSPVEYSETWPRPNGGHWTWRPSEDTVSGSGYSRHYEYQYDSHANLTDVFGDLTGTRALNRHHTSPTAQVAPTPTTAASDGPHQLLTHIDLDSFGQPIRVVSDGGSQCMKIEYDPLFRQLPISSIRFPAGCSGDASLITSQSFDRGFEAVTQTVGPDNAVTRTILDLFGRVSQVFEPDPESGGAENVARVTTEYLEPPGGPFRIVHTIQLLNSFGDIRNTWQLIDGLGRPAAYIADADPINDPQPGIVSGLAERDKMGLPKKRYLPFFSSYEPTTSTLPTVGSEAAVKVEYDSFGRIDKAFQPDGSQASRHIYHAITEETYDAIDISSADPHPLSVAVDGHGRVISTSQSTNVGGSGGASFDVLTTKLTYLPTGELVTLLRSHSSEQSDYVRTMTYDSLGRLVSNAEPNTSGWLYAYDIGGYLVATSDARGCGVNYAYDGAGRLISQDYSPCLTSQAAYTSPQPNGDGTELFLHYDTVESGQTGDYGPKETFLRGRLAAISDRAQHTRLAYDGRGRTVGVAKQLAQPNASAISALTGRYTQSWFRTATAYDEANRPISQSTGADITKLQAAGPSGLTSVIESELDVRDIPTLVSGSYGILVSNEVRDADGLLLARTYGDVAGTTAQYSYNNNRWLTRSLASRIPPAIWNEGAPGYPAPSPSEPYLTQVAPTATLQTILLDTKYGNFNAIGNALSLVDDRLQHEWPAGAKPVSRNLTYDDLYRLRAVSYSYYSYFGASSDIQSPLFLPSDLSPMPLPLPSDRIQSQTFDFDWQDNLVASRATPDAFFSRSIGAASYGSPTSGPNQIREVPGASLSYDMTGNLTELSEAPQAGRASFTLQYQWDEVGCLASATRTDYSGFDVHGSTGVTYTYDAAGSRVTRSITVDGGTPAYFLEIFPSLRVDDTTWDMTTNDYVRDETTETAYAVANGASYGRIVYDATAPSANESPLHVYLQLRDALGSTSSSIDLASSELVEQTTYLAQGGAESDYRPARWNTFRENYRYTGKEDDYQVGLIYFGQRYLSPGLGRWISPDPLTIHSLAGSSNPYSFASESPLKFTDPNGLDDDGDEDETTGVSANSISGTAASSQSEQPNPFGSMAFQLTLQDTTGSYDPDSYDPTQTCCLSDILSGTHWEQYLSQGPSGAEFISNATAYWNPNASSLIEAQLLPFYQRNLTWAEQNPSDARTAASILGPPVMLGLSLVPGISQYMVFANPRAGWAAKAFSVLTLVPQLAAIAKFGRLATVGGEFSRIAPGGGLMAAENAGGHLIEMHIGWTEEQLAARLARQLEIQAASTFATRAEAEAAVAGAFETGSNPSAVAYWVSSGAKGRIAIEGPFSGGLTLERGAAAALPGTGVRVVLKGNGAGGYFIFTGFPFR